MENAFLQHTAYPILSELAEFCKRYNKYTLFFFHSPCIFVIKMSLLMFLIFKRVYSDFSRSSEGVGAICVIVLMFLILTFFIIIIA